MEPGFADRRTQPNRIRNSLDGIFHRVIDAAQLDRIHMQFDRSRLRRGQDDAGVKDDHKRLVSNGRALKMFAMLTRLQTLKLSTAIEPWSRRTGRPVPLLNWDSRS